MIQHAGGKKHQWAFIFSVVKVHRVRSCRSDVANLIKMFAVLVSPDDSSSRGGAEAANGDSDHTPELAGKLGNHALNIFRSTVARQSLNRWGGKRISSNINKHTQAGCLHPKLALTEWRHVHLHEVWFGGTPPPLLILSVLQLNTSLLVTVIGFPLFVWHELSVHVRGPWRWGCSDTKCAKKIGLWLGFKYDTVAFGVARGPFQAIRDHLSQVIKSHVPVWIIVDIPVMYWGCIWDAVTLGGDPANRRSELPCPWRKELFLLVSQFWWGYKRPWIHSLGLY